MKKKISFCTVCMNRLHHLRKTLPVNLKNTKNFENLEFVLLDYNSSDGLEDYVKNDLATYVQSGRLVYYKTNTPVHFHRSHSRNLVFKLATGDIVCNIDADNFTESDFPVYVQKIFTESPNTFLTTIGTNGNLFRKDVLGRICVNKKDFYRVGGFDERMSYYGFEDYDFVNRLEFNGVIRSVFSQNFRLVALQHHLTERTANEYVTQNLEILAFRYLTPASTELYFMFKNGDVKKGVMVDNANFRYTEPFTPLKQTQIKYKYSIYDDQWTKGVWRPVKSGLEFSWSGGKMELFIYDPEMSRYYRDPDHTEFIYRISEKRLRHQAVMFFSQITNRLIMNQNRLNRQAIVNLDGFGKDTVFKNFDLITPLTIF